MSRFLPWSMCVALLIGSGCTAGPDPVELMREGRFKEASRILNDKDYLTRKERVRIGRNFFTAYTYLLEPKLTIEVFSDDEVDALLGYLPEKFATGKVALLRAKFEVNDPEVWVHLNDSLRPPAIAEGVHLYARISRFYASTSHSAEGLEHSVRMAGRKAPRYRDSSSPAGAAWGLLPDVVQDGLKQFKPEAPTSAGGVYPEDRYLVEPWSMTRKWEQAAAEALAELLNGAEVRRGQGRCQAIYLWRKPQKVHHSEAEDLLRIGVDYQREKVYHPRFDSHKKLLSLQPLPEGTDWPDRVNAQGVVELTDLVKPLPASAPSD